MAKEEVHYGDRVVQHGNLQEGTSRRLTFEAERSEIVLLQVFRVVGAESIGSRHSRNDS